MTKPRDLGKLIASGGGFGTSGFPKYQTNPIQFDDFPIFPHIVSLRPPFIGIPLFHGDFHVKPWISTWNRFGAWELLHPGGGHGSAWRATLGAYL